MSKGIDLIKAERLRQILDEKYDAEHDDMHIYGELSVAAATYALPPGRKGEKDYIHKHGDREINNWIPKLWPFEPHFYKPSEEGFLIADRQKELAKAGALIAAEIDRLERIRQIAEANAKGIEPTDSDELKKAVE